MFQIKHTQVLKFLILSIATLNWAENPQKAELALSVAGCLIAPQPLQRPIEKMCVCVRVCMCVCDDQSCVDCGWYYFKNRHNIKAPESWGLQRTFYVRRAAVFSHSANPWQFTTFTASTLWSQWFPAPSTPTCYVALFQGLAAFTSLWFSSVCVKCSHLCWYLVLAKKKKTITSIDRSPVRVHTIYRLSQCPRFQYALIITLVQLSKNQVTTSADLFKDFVTFSHLKCLKWL